MSVKTLNILYINHYYRTNDSASVSSHEIINGLTSIGHNLTILTHDPCTLYRTPTNHVKIVRIGFSPTTERSRLLKFLRCTVGYLFIFLVGLKLCRKEKIDCIFSQHHNFHLATVTTSVLSSFLNVPFVVKIQDVVPWPNGILDTVYRRHFMRTLNGYALRRARYILSLSRELNNLLTKIFRVSNDRLIILANTVGDFLTKSVTIEEPKNRLGLRNDRVLIFVGSTKKRGVELLIKALPRILRRAPDVKLLLVGGSAGHNALNSLAVSVGVEKRVKFIGPVSHWFVHSLISMSDIAIGPLISFQSTTGAVPRKVLEYMACSKPVVCCYGAVSRDLLINGYNGMLVRSGDIDDLSSAIINLIENKKLAEKIGNNARRHVSRFYGQDILLTKLSELLNVIAAESFGAVG